MKRAKIIFSKEKFKEYIKPTKKKIIILAAVIAVIAGASAMGSSKKTKSVMAQQTDVVTRGNIDVTITGSAAVEPYERFEIIPKVSGDIIYCPFDVGDAVNEGDLLYGFDTSNTDLTVERQRLSMQQSENSYKNALEDNDKLSLKAKNNGIISELTIKAGQEINAGTKIASVDDTTNLEVVLPFTQSQIGSIHIGDSATVTSSKHMSSVFGTVTHKSSASFAAADGTTLYNVTISFSNPGAFYSGLTVGGSVGENVSPGSGVIENCATGTIIAETEGTVSKVYYKNGDYVKKGTVIATLTSDSVSDRIKDSTLSYKSAQLSMQQTEKDLEDYNITSPISGTVITKNSKAGDTIDKTNSQTTMMVVADISRLKFNLSIDELDVSKVSEGLPVSITCDALPDEKFTGYITTVSVEGEAQNGVTTYSAEVVIDEPGNLRPSMNIDAEIIVDSASDTLMVPSEDIKTVFKKSYVFVKGEAADDKNKSKKGKMPNGETPKKGNMPYGKNNTDDAKGYTPEAPDGYIAIEVEVGVSNDDFTEIISGLKEGQEIYRQSTLSNSDSRSFMMGGQGGMSGGMGGHPGGGMGGGMR